MFYLGLYCLSFWKKVIIIIVVVIIIIIIIFFFCLHLPHMEVPAPGIKSEPDPNPLCQDGDQIGASTEKNHINNPLAIAGTPQSFYF